MLALRRSCGSTPSNILTSQVTSSSSSRRGWQSSLLAYQTDVNKHHYYNKRRSIHHYPFVNKPSLLSTAITQQLRGGDNEHIICTNSTIRTNNTTSSTIPNQSQKPPSWRRAYLAVGSNLGDKYQNIAKALKLLQTSNPTSIKLIRTSYLRSTSPMYVTDQPSFLNGAVEVETSLSPLELLSSIKCVESDLGRDLNSTAQRFGPRPVDLDILLFDGYEITNDDGTAAETLDDNEVMPNSLVMNTERLEIPHPRMLEREFVLSPMKDLEEGKKSDNDKIIHPISNKTMSELLDSLLKRQHNSSTTNVEDEAMRVLPLPRGRMLLFNETIIMGILNVTPDSFSDGGKLSNSSELAASQALQLVKDGAGIIDVGGESTRPGAEEVAIKEELERVIPVIRQIREEGSDIPISIDTRHAVVARAAIEAGADIVNDVSGGTHDPEMLSCVASMGVPMIIMHMRGNPKTMQSLTNYTKVDSSSGSTTDDESGVVSVVARELMQRSAAAEAAGIPRWLQVVDPGIGFAKDLDGNLSLMKGVDTLRSSCANLPFLYGPSRKGFIGKITGETDPEQRDYGTIAACLASIKQSRSDSGKNEDCNILRVHNAKAVKQAVQVYEAIMNANK